MKFPRPKLRSPFNRPPGTSPGKTGNFYWTEDKGPLSMFIRPKPDTHGPFRSEDEAVDDAIKVLEEQYADKLNRSLHDIKSD